MKAHQTPLRLAISLSIAIFSPLAVADETATAEAPSSAPMTEADRQKAEEQPAMAEEAATALAPPGAPAPESDAPKADEQPAVTEEAEAVLTPPNTATPEPDTKKAEEQAATAEETATAEAPARTPVPEPDIKKGEEKSQVCIACHGEQGISQQDNYPHLHGQQQTYLLRQLRYFRDGKGDRRDPIMTPMLENMTDQDLVNLAAYYASFNKVLGTADYQTNPVDEKPMPTPDIPEKTEGEATKADTMMATDEKTPETVAAVATQAATETPAAQPQAVAPAATTTLVGDATAGKTKSAACMGCHGADGVGTSPLFPNLNGQKPEYLASQLKAFRDGQRQDPSMAPMAMALSDQDIADLAAYYGAMK